MALSFVPWVLAALALTAVAPLASTETKKVKVTVIHEGEDRVGRELVFAVREAIRRSEGYALVSESDAAVVIQMVTLDPADVTLDPADDGVQTAAAVVYTLKNWLPLNKEDPQTWYPIFLNARLSLAGRRSVGESAQGIVARLDSVVEKFRNARIE